MKALRAQRWAVRQPETIDWREWDDEFVVRVGSRSETHLMNAAAGSVLLALLEAPALTVDDLYAMTIDVAHAGSDSGEAGTSAIHRGSLQAILANFEWLGIVATTPD